jgi:hypothetical protein
MEVFFLSLNLDKFIDFKHPLETYTLTVLQVPSEPFMLEIERIVKEEQAGADKKVNGWVWSIQNRLLKNRGLPPFKINVYSKRLEHNKMEVVFAASYGLRELDFDSAVKGAFIELQDSIEIKQGARVVKW